jgi:hypothetical protein
MELGYGAGRVQVSPSLARGGTDLSPLRERYTSPPESRIGARVIAFIALLGDPSRAPMAEDRRGSGEVWVGGNSVLANIEAFDLFLFGDTNAQRPLQNEPHDGRESEHEDADADDPNDLGKE